MTGFVIGTYPAAIEIAIARTKDNGTLFSHRPDRNRNLSIVSADRSDGMTREQAIQKLKDGDPL